MTPLSHPPPASVEAQNQRTSNASSTFVGSLAVADALPGDDEPDSEIQPTNDASDTSTRYTDTNSEAGRLRERWTDVIGALMTAAVAAKRYDARCAAALRRLASSAGVRWSRIAALEDSLALHLKSILRSQRGADPGADPGADLGADASSPSMSPSTQTAHKPQTSAPHEEGSVVGWISGTFRNMSASRALSVTAAAAVGGGVLFVTGGLAAPAVVASLASMGAAGGILGTAALSMGTLLAYFGGAGGISMIFGGVGAGLTGWRMLNRTSGLSQFAFLHVRGTGAGMSVYLLVPGFLRDPADLFRTWGATDGVYSVMLKLPKRSDVNGHLDDDDDVKGSLVAGLGMWLKRDVDTREVFVSWIDPGGVADRAGVAEGSVLTALATRVDAPDSPNDPSNDGTDTETTRQHAPIVRRVRGGGDDSNDTTALSLSQVRAVLAGKDRTRSGEKLSEFSDEMSGSGDGTVVAELWLRRNLAAGDDVEKIAKRRGLPKLKLFRRKAELKRKAKLAEAMVGASQAPAAPTGEVKDDAEDDVKDDVDDDDEDDEDDEDDDDNDDTDDDTEAPKEDTKASKSASQSPPSSPSVQHKWHRAGIDALRSIGHGVASVASIVPFVGSAHTPTEGRKKDDAADASTDSNGAGPGKPGDEKKSSKSSAAAAAKLAESWPPTQRRATRRRVGARLTD